MASNTEYERLVQTKKSQYGSKFDASDLAPQFRRHFHTGQRLKVRNIDGRERTGTVGVTTGWKPVFILMHRSTDHGSTDVLGKYDVVVAEQVGGKYIPIRTLEDA